MRKGLKGIIDKVGVTSILVTHDQEEAFDLADQIVIFNRCARASCLLHVTHHSSWARTGCSGVPVVLPQMM